MKNCLANVLRRIEFQPYDAAAAPGKQPFSLFLHEFAHVIQISGAWTDFQLRKHAVALRSHEDRSTSAWGRFLRRHVIAMGGATKKTRSSSSLEENKDDALWSDDVAYVASQTLRHDEALFYKKMSEVWEFYGPEIDDLSCEEDKNVYHWIREAYGFFLASFTQYDCRVVKQRTEVEKNPAQEEKKDEQRRRTAFHLAEIANLSKYRGSRQSSEPGTRIKEIAAGDCGLHRDRYVTFSKSLNFVTKNAGLPAMADVFERVSLGDMLVGELGIYRIWQEDWVFPRGRWLVNELSSRFTRRHSCHGGTVVMLVLAYHMFLQDLQFAHALNVLFELADYVLLRPESVDESDWGLTKEDVFATLVSAGRFLGDVCLREVEEMLFQEDVDPRDRVDEVQIEEQEEDSFWAGVLAKFGVKVDHDVEDAHLLVSGKSSDRKRAAMLRSWRARIRDEVARDPRAIALYCQDFFWQNRFRGVHPKHFAQTATDQTGGFLLEFLEDFLEIPAHTLLANGMPRAEPHGFFPRFGSAGQYGGAKQTPGEHEHPEHQEKDEQRGEQDERTTSHSDAPAKEQEFASVFPVAVALDLFFNQTAFLRRKAYHEMGVNTYASDVPVFLRKRLAEPRMHSIHHAAERIDPEWLNHIVREKLAKFHRLDHEEVDHGREPEGEGEVGEAAGSSRGSARGAVAQHHDLADLLLQSSSEEEEEEAFLTRDKEQTSTTSTESHEDLQYTSATRTTSRPASLRTAAGASAADPQNLRPQTPFFRSLPTWQIARPYFRNEVYVRHPCAQGVVRNACVHYEHVYTDSLPEGSLLSSCAELRQRAYVRTKRLPESFKSLKRARFGVVSNMNLPANVGHDMTWYVPLAEQVRALQKSLRVAEVVEGEQREEVEVQLFYHYHFGNSLQRQWERTILSTGNYSKAEDERVSERLRALKRDSENAVVGDGTWSSAAVLEVGRRLAAFLDDEVVPRLAAGEQRAFYYDDLFRNFLGVPVFHSLHSAKEVRCYDHLVWGRGPLYNMRHAAHAETVVHESAVVSETFFLGIEAPPETLRLVDEHRAAGAEGKASWSSSTTMNEGRGHDGVTMSSSSGPPYYEDDRESSVANSRLTTHFIKEMATPLERHLCGLPRLGFLAKTGTSSLRNTEATYELMDADTSARTYLSDLSSLAADGLIHPPAPGADAQLQHALDDKNVDLALAAAWRDEVRCLPVLQHEAGQLARKDIVDRLRDSATYYQRILTTFATDREKDMPRTFSRKSTSLVGKKKIN
eukprot:g9391.t1